MTDAIKLVLTAGGTAAPSTDLNRSPLRALTERSLEQGDTSPETHPSVP